MRDPAPEPALLPPPATVPRVMISAAHKSSGKTTLTIGLCAALHARGLQVAPFKKGPDYIDPLWLSRASGRACYNLDPHLMPWPALAGLFARHAPGADIAIVEGNKGLYDGLALDGSNSNAAVAVALGLPVVLVIDARGMTRGIAPLVLGYQAFDPRIRIGGVILNRVGGARHEAKLRAVLEHYTDVPVLGAVHEDEAIGIVERHLGLMPANEADDADARVARIARAVARQVDLDRLLAVARAAAPLAPAAAPVAAPPGPATGTRLRVGIALDRAFGFYYRDDLEELRAAGAELVPFDTLNDRTLPAVDALFIGGGFPESCAAALEANSGLRRQIRAALDDGMPAYAECGGLMYLARSLEFAGRRFAMVGAIAADVQMHRRPVGRGYVELQPTALAPFSVACAPGAPVRGHEFHYSALSGLPADTRFAYRVVRGHGVDGHNDGIVQRNLLASYSHLRSGAGSAWAGRFVQYAGRIARQRRGAAPAIDNPQEWSLVR